MHNRMDWKTVSFDWNQIRAFLATAEEGSFSAAARALSLTQPTLGRQIAALEGELGVLLFDRGGRSPSLTQAGMELLEHARGMLGAATTLSLAASGQSEAIEGQVCITANEIMSAFILPPIISRLRDKAPGIEIKLVASDEYRDLTRREADIAIRHKRPNQSDLIAKLVGQTRVHLYAATSYIDAFGRENLEKNLSEADFITDGHYERAMRVLNSRGLSLSKTNFKIVTNSRVANWEMVKLGLGIAIMTEDFAHNTPGIEQVVPDRVSLKLPIWLATHQELRTSRRIRLVFDELADSFSSSKRYRM